MALEKGTTMTQNTWTYDETMVFLHTGKKAPALLQQWIARWNATPTTRTHLSHDPEYVLRAGASYGDILEEAASVREIRSQAWLIPSADARAELKALMSYGVAREAIQPMPWAARIQVQLQGWGYDLS